MNDSVMLCIPSNLQNCKAEAGDPFLSYVHANTNFLSIVLIIQKGKAILLVCYPQPEFLAKFKNNFPKVSPGRGLEQTH